MYSVGLFGSQAGDEQQQDAPSHIQQALVDFVMDFHLDNIFIYRYSEELAWPRVVLTFR